MNAAVLEQDGAVTAVLNYHLDDGTKPVNETFGPANIHGRSTGTPDKQPMPIANARLIAGQLSLDTHGFCLARGAF